MITGEKLLCREQNLTEGEVTYFMGCRNVEEAKTEIRHVKKKWADIDNLPGALVVYGVACDASSCYAFTPEDLVRYVGCKERKSQAAVVYTELLERVRLSYCETEDKSDYYSVLELYMDLGDILES